MTDEQLLFTAADAAVDAARLCKLAWDEQKCVMTRAQAVKLEMLSRALHCAATELANRASGQPAPKVG